MQNTANSIGYWLCFAPCIPSRSGARAIRGDFDDRPYYWWDGQRQFWLFTLFDKDEMDDLSAQERQALKHMLKAELEARR